MAVQETLEKIGFTNNEVKVYLALVNMGSSLAGNIAKKANLHRRPVYDSLARLIEKGLVSYTIKAGKKYFQATNPEKLLEIVKEREIEVKSILPEIKEKFKAKKPEVFAEIYEGKEGLKTVMEDILKTLKKGEEWLTIGSTGKGPIALPFYLEQFAKRREKQKIRRKILIADTLEGHNYAKMLIKQKYIQLKFLPKEIQNPQTIWVYNNKVALILVSEEHPVIFLIENKDIANSYRDYFNLLWKSSN